MDPKASYTTQTLTAGFEPAHAKHNGLAVHPRNHLGMPTVTLACRILFRDYHNFPFVAFHMVSPELECFPRKRNLHFWSPDGTTDLPYCVGHALPQTYVVS